MMDAKTCLKKLSYVGVLAFATIGKQGVPQVRNISAIHFENDRLYFFTARGKAFCQELLQNPETQILGYTRFKEMIRVSARALPVAENERLPWIGRIFQKQPYLYNVYPRDTGKMAGIVFEIRDMAIEYFNLDERPIFREIYTLGNRQAAAKGYAITDECVTCGACAENCPQSCIEAGTPYRIEPSHCLQCGNCRQCCPVGAVIQLD